MAFRDRIVAFRMVPAIQLIPDARNWRRHSEAQREALSGVLDMIGFAGAVIARETDDGSLVVIDGHLRVDLDADQMVPVLVTDLDEAEAGAVLASYDTLGSMAETDADALAALLKDVGGDMDPAVFESVRLWSGLADDALERMAGTDGVLPDDDVETVVWAVNVPQEAYDDIVSRVQVLAERDGVTAGEAVARAVARYEDGTASQQEGRDATG